MKILIVHGWLHSKDLYKNLNHDLESLGYEVTLYEFPGFGSTEVRYRKNILNNYAKDLREELLACKYDYAIGHSMGGNILLRAASKIDNVRLILLSPNYNGVNRIKGVTLLTPLILISLYMFKLIKPKYLIQCLALITVNRFDLVSDQIVTDTLRADPVVAVVSMIELAWDGWRIHSTYNGISILFGSRDRLIGKKSIDMLCHDSHGICTEIYGVGHTLVLEAYDELLNIIIKIVGKG